MLRDPASAVAVSKCLVNRSRTRLTEMRTDSFHPRPCAWCEYSADALLELLNGFNDWAGYDSRFGRYRQQTVEQFRAFPLAVQSRMVAEAQYPEEAAA